VYEQSKTGGVLFGPRLQLQGPYAAPEHWSNVVEWKSASFSAGDSFTTTFTMGYPAVTQDAGTFYSIGVGADIRGTITFHSLRQSVTNGYVLRLQLGISSFGYRCVNLVQTETTAFTSRALERKTTTLREPGPSITMLPSIS